MPCVLMYCADDVYTRTDAVELEPYPKPYMHPKHLYDDLSGNAEQVGSTLSKIACQ